MNPIRGREQEGVNSYPILISSNIPFQNQKPPWFGLVWLHSPPSRSQLNPPLRSGWTMEKSSSVYFGYCYRGDSSQGVG